MYFRQKLVELGPTLPDSYSFSPKKRPFVSSILSSNMLRTEIAEEFPDLHDGIGDAFLGTDFTFQTGGKFSTENRKHRTLILEVKLRTTRIHCLADKIGFRNWE